MVTILKGIAFKRVRFCIEYHSTKGPCVSSYLSKSFVCCQMTFIGHAQDDSHHAEDIRQATG